MPMTTRGSLDFGVASSSSFVVLSIIVAASTSFIVVFQHLHHLFLLLHLLYGDAVVSVETSASMGDHSHSSRVLHPDSSF